MAEVAAEMIARRFSRTRVLEVKPGKYGRAVVILLAMPQVLEVHYGPTGTVPCAGPGCGLCGGWKGEKGYAPCAAPWKNPVDAEWVQVPRVLECTEAALSDLQPEWVGKTLVVEREGEKRNSRMCISLAAQQIATCTVKPFDALAHMERTIWHGRSRNNRVLRDLDQPGILTMPGRTG